MVSDDERVPMQKGDAAPAVRCPVCHGQLVAQARAGRVLFCCQGCTAAQLPASSHTDRKAEQ